MSLSIITEIMSTVFSTHYPAILRSIFRPDRESPLRTLSTIVSRLPSSTIEFCRCYT